VEGLVLSVAPKYFGSWKGMVLKAIAVDGARFWGQIQRATGLEPEELNQALSELFQVDVLSKREDGYWIDDYDLYTAYVEYYSQLQDPSAPGETDRPVISPEDREKINHFLAYCKENRHISRKQAMQPVLACAMAIMDFENCSEHFYLEGDSLDRLSKDVISFSEKRVVVVNPYVDKCGLSDKLREACSSGREVLLVTRSPGLDRAGRARDQKWAYHRALEQSGVEMFYNDYVHAKLMVVDDLVALVSSMNFISSSSGGKSWEAGMVTWQKNNVESIGGSIQKIIDGPETKSG
jgi:phosphatidylserine/phosphatidylglycerophosphate/cardiolipin synthase-like enzyme